MSWAELPPIRIAWRGRVPLERALAEQRAHREAMLGDPEAPEVLWLLEHPPTVTTGLRAAAGLPEPDWLAARGVALVRTERGGLATYHGPGQLIGYALLRLRPRGLSVTALIRALEEGLIRWSEQHGLPAGRRPGAPGVWCEAGKIASVGVHIRRGVSMHGFALNLDPDLEPFGWIRPCGLEPTAVTSVARATGSAESPRDAAFKVADQVLWSLLAHSVDSAGDTR